MSRPITTRREGSEAVPAGASLCLPNGYRLTRAKAGDHPAIYRLLRQVAQQPSEAEFQAQLDEPTYEPTDRLLIKRGSETVAHLRIIHREMYLDSAIIPVAWFADMVTQADHRRRGCGTALLAAAERVAIADGAVLGVLRARCNGFYHRAGWRHCSDRFFSTVSPQNLLVLHEGAASRPAVLSEPRAAPLHIRFWRHVEQPALVRLYGGFASRVSGCWVRSEAYWRWLVNRRACDRVYVAVEGVPRPELDDAFDSILAYAFERNGRIAELVADPHRPDAVRELLVRVCRDAMERNILNIELDAPPGDPLHAQFAAANGESSTVIDNAGVFMGKLLDLAGLIKRMRHILHSRARAAGISSGTKLGIQVDHRKYVLSITGRTVRLSPVRRLARDCLVCGTGRLLKLLLGLCPLEADVARGDITCSNPTAGRLAAALLPQLKFWFPPLDDMPAK